MAKYLDPDGAQHLVNNCVKLINNSTEELRNSISNVYRYRGSVQSMRNLSSNGNQIGDVYNIETAEPSLNIKAGDNVAWNGTTWDNLSGIVDIDLSNIPNTPLTATEIDRMFESSETE